MVVSGINRRHGCAHRAGRAFEAHGIDLEVQSGAMQHAWHERVAIIAIGWPIKVAMGWPTKVATRWPSKAAKTDPPPRLARLTGSR
jgi:hypothetical protein